VCGGSWNIPYRDRINAAKDSDKEFVNGMLNVSGNRAGLVSFNDEVDSFHNISDNNQSLQGSIDYYSQGGSTCICCGINKSIGLLSQKYLTNILIGQASEWKYNLDYPLEDPIINSGWNWTDKDYNDTGWLSGNATLGFFNANWSYRKQLNLTNTAGNLSQYPVRINMNLSSDYLSGRIRSYCEDARFTYYNATSGMETEIPYLIESCNLTQTTNSSFWVKMPNIANNSTTRIYIYYGNNFSLPASDPSVCRAGIIGGKCSKFFNGFEDSIAVGKGFNTYAWEVAYGSTLDKARTQVDAGYYHGGIWAAEMKEGTTGIVAITTAQGNLNMTDCKHCSLDFWLKLTTGNWASGDRFYLDVYDGSWHNATMNLSGSTYDTGAWFNFTLNLSIYNLSDNFRVRFRSYASNNTKESHLDDVRIYYSAQTEPRLVSVGVQEILSKMLSINLTTTLGNNGGNYYFRKKFYLDGTDKIVNLTIYSLTDDGAEIYLNGHILDNDTLKHNASYWNRQIQVNSSQLEIGWNVIAVKLKNNDSASAFFDLKMDNVISRKRAMLVMSDGDANVECTPLQSSTLQGPIDAIQSACNARLDNITVYSVAFGTDANVATLRKIACWNCTSNAWLSGENATNCSRFFQSSSLEDLKEIYQKIAQDIVNMSIERQAMYVEGGFSYRDTLYNDSYIKLTSSGGVVFGDGEFMLTFEKNCSNGTCILNKSSGVSVLDAKVTTYSGDYWADRAIVTNSSGNNSTIYNLSKYGPFESLGDPYSISIPPAYFSSGKNNISLFLGEKAGQAQNISRADKIIYSIKLPGYVGYGEGLVFNSSQEARANATRRLINNLTSISGEELSSYNISTSLSIEGIRNLTQVTLVKFIIW